VFHDQIEAKQQALQPWTAQIDARETARNVAQGELEGLFRKSEAAEVASQEADERADALAAARQAKDADLQRVQAERAKVLSELKTKQGQLQVGAPVGAADRR
jgi:chromosome segregation ATPase